MEILDAKKILKIYGNTYFDKMLKRELASVITAMQTIGKYNGNLVKVSELSESEIRKISRYDLIQIIQISKQFIGEIP